MKKLFKFIAILFGIFVALLIVGTIAIKIFFPAEKVKSLILKELTTRLKREVSIDHVSLSVVKGLELQHIRLSESPTFAKGTFVTVDSLGVRVRLLPLLAKRVEVDSILLVSPKISVVRFADGKTFNFSDLLSTAPATAPTTQVAEADCQGLVPCAFAAGPESSPAPGPAVALQVSKIEIQNGEIRFSDHSPAHQNADIDALNLKVNNFTMTDFFSASWQAKVRILGLAVVSQGSAKINLQTAVIQLVNTVITLGESKIEASGQVSNYSSAVPKMDLKILLDAFTPASLGALAALPPALSWVGAATGNLTLNGDLQNLNMGGNLHLDTVQLKYGSVFQKPSKTPFSFSFNGSVLKQSTALIRDWGLKLSSLNATGNARVEGLAQKLPALSLHLTTNEFSVPELLELSPGSLPPGTKIQGPARVTADVTGTPASAHLVAKINGDNLVISSSNTFKKPAGMPLELLFKGEAVQNGDRFNIESLNLNLGRIVTTLNGTYQAQGKEDARLALAVKTNDFPLDELPRLSPLAAGYQLSGPGRFDAHIGNLKSAPSIDGTLTLHQVNVKSAEDQVQQAEASIHFITPNALAPSPRLTLKSDGHVTAAHVHDTYYDGSALKLTWNLTDITEDLGKISGAAQFSQGPGALRNAEKLAAQSKTAKLVLQPIQVLQDLQKKGLLKQVGLPSMDNIAFSSIRGDYTFQLGQMTIKTFDLTGQDLSATSVGTIGLAGARPLNLHNQIKLAKGAIGGTVGQIFQDDQGRPTFKFNVTGTADKPDVKFDLQEAGQKAVKQLGQELLKGVTGNGNASQNLEQIGNNLKNLFK